MDIAMVRLTCGRLCPVVGRECPVSTEAKRSARVREVWQGGPVIHGRQHPPDLFMELAATYDRPLAGDLPWQLYGGPPWPSLP
jgi:hypothetical protein